ncbi:MAG: hypothetical protein L3J47_11985 [Sulfurovum sp.]|nr:hypothetical protein [Sulfurovum sp.]
MHNYTEALIWYAAWPVLIYLAYRFVLLNLRHHGKMERLEELEARYAQEKYETKTDQTND